MQKQMACGSKPPREGSSWHIYRAGSLPSPVVRSHNLVVTISSYQVPLPNSDFQIVRCNSKSQDFDLVTCPNSPSSLIGLLWNWQQDSEMKEGISKGMNMKWSLYMSSNQQNLTIGSIGLKSDYRVVKISLTTGLGSDPEVWLATPKEMRPLAYPYIPHARARCYLTRCAGIHSKRSV